MAYGIPHASKTSVELYYVRLDEEGRARYGMVATYPVPWITALRWVPQYDTNGTVGVDLFIYQSDARRAAMRLAPL